MKKHGIAGLACCLVFLVLFSKQIAAAESVVALSDAIIIPESGGVLVHISDGKSEKITESRLFLPGMSIAPENATPFAILCPDFTTLSVSPGETFRCPERDLAAAPDVLLLAESDEKSEEDEQSSYWTYWPTAPVESPKEPGESKPMFARAINMMEQLPETSTDSGLKNILCHLYSKANRDDEASRCYLEEMGLLENSENVRHKALTRYEFALNLWKINQKAASVRWAQEALQLYQQVEEYRGEFQVPEQGFLRLARANQDAETQAFARHHLALLYWFYRAMAAKQALKARELYEQIENPDMMEQIEHLLQTMSGK